MLKPRLLDAFSGAGGAAYGYMLAGFDVTGIDIKPQPRYAGDEFIQADALKYVASHGHEFDVIHSSPPCQFYSKATPMQYRCNHPDLIAPTRELLQATGKPYVIENVENARKHLMNPVKLCGSMFGLNLWRHRYFEIWPTTLLLTPPCNHSELPVLITGTTRRRAGANVVRFDHTAQECRDASGLHWMTRQEMDEAIPPSYTLWIGQHLMRILQPEVVTV